MAMFTILNLHRQLYPWRIFNLRVFYYYMKSKLWPAEKILEVKLGRQSCFFSNSFGQSTMLVIMVISVVFAISFIAMQSWMYYRIQRKQIIRQAYLASYISEDLSQLTMNALDSANKAAYDTYLACLSAPAPNTCVFTNCGNQVNGVNVFAYGPTGIPGCWPPTNVAPTAVVAASFCPAGFFLAKLTGINNGAGDNANPLNAAPWACWPIPAGIAVPAAGNVRCIADPLGRATNYCLSENGTIIRENGNPQVYARFDRFMNGLFRSFFKLEKYIQPISKALANPPDQTTAVATAVRDWPDKVSTISVPACDPAALLPSQCERPTDLGAAGTVSSQMQNLIFNDLAGNAMTFQQPVKIINNIQIPITPNADPASAGLTGQIWCDRYEQNLLPTGSPPLLTQAVWTCLAVRISGAPADSACTLAIPIPIAAGAGPPALTTVYCGPSLNRPML